MGGIYAREDGRAGGGLEGDLLPLPADRRRSRRAAVARRSSGEAAVDVGGGVAGRQARHARRAVPGGRAADRIARSVRAAAAGARRRADPAGPAGADRRRSRSPALRRSARRARARHSATAAGDRGRGSAAASRSCASACAYVLEQRGLRPAKRARRRRDRRRRPTARRCDVARSAAGAARVRRRRAFQAAWRRCSSACKNIARELRGAAADELDALGGARRSRPSRRCSTSSTRGGRDRAAARRGATTARRSPRPRGFEPAVDRFFTKCS